MNIPPVLNTFLTNIVKGVYGQASLTFFELNSFKEKANKEDISYLLTLCLDLEYINIHFKNESIDLTVERIEFFIRNSI